MSTEGSKEKKIPSWITFIGVVLLLIGIYGAVRTGINLSFFEKYPPEGILGIPWAQPYYPQREQECMYPHPYYEPDGKTTRPATPEEKENEAISTQICLDGAREARERAKINDLSQSVLFLFLGIGILTTRRIFFK